MYVKQLHHVDLFKIFTSKIKISTLYLHFVKITKIFSSCEIEKIKWIYFFYKMVIVVNNDGDTSLESCIK